jgi:hypothetical protein
VLEQEGPREEAAAKAKADAAKQVEAATKELAGVRTLAEQLGAFLPEAIQTFQSRWGAKEPNWVEVSEQYGAEETQKLKWRYDAEQKQLSELAQTTQTAQAEAHKAFVQTEWKALADLAPDLAPDATDPTKGAEKRQEVTKYLATNGIPQDAIAQISAREMLLAHKAMLWDRAQAALKAAPKPKPTATRPESAGSPGRLAGAALRTSKSPRSHRPLPREADRRQRRGPASSPQGMNP